MKYEDIPTTPNQNLLTFLVKRGLIPEKHGKNKQEKW